MRILFFGTPTFAVPTLERLVAGPHEVVGVVTQPDRPRGRGRRASPSPIARCAAAAHLHVERPERVGASDAVAALAALAPDLGVVAAFGQFLPRSVRELPARGYMINAHASLLPKFRGAAPIAHAIWQGEPETGISVMRVEKEMDAGPVALVRRTAIGPDENAGQLEQRLALLAAAAIAEAVDQIAAGPIRWVEQDHARATLAPKLDARCAELDFEAAAETLARQVRALAPRPGAFTRWRGERLRILAARAIPGEAQPPPGGVALVDDTPRIATGRGWLEPAQLQRAGGKPLSVADFQRGRGLESGDVLGANG